MFCMNFTLLWCFVFAGDFYWRESRRVQCQNQLTLICLVDGVLGGKQVA